MNSIIIRENQRPNWYNFGVTVFNISTRIIIVILNMFKVYCLQAKAKTVS